jgi:hypothetical protein
MQSSSTPCLVLVGRDALHGANQWIERGVLDSFWLNVAYSFHMPLFAFLSSYVLLGREGRPLDLVGKRAVSLMLPYVVWVIVGYLSVGTFSLRGVADYLGTRLVYPQSPGAPWFLCALRVLRRVHDDSRHSAGRTRALVASIRSRLPSLCRSQE